MTTNCYAMVRGSVARFTRLTPQGKPTVSGGESVLTSGIVKITVSTRDDNKGYEMLRSSEEVQRVQFYEKYDLIGFDVTISMSGVNPDLLNVLTTQTPVENAAGDTVGNDFSTEHRVANYGLEVWSRLAVPVNGYQYGYTVFPWVRGGVASGFRVDAKSALSFEVKGGRTSRYGVWSSEPTGSGWDRAPWDTMGWDDDPVSPDAPDPLLVDRPGLHFRQTLTNYIPVSKNGGWDRVPWDTAGWDDAAREPVCATY